MATLVHGVLANLAVMIVVGLGFAVGGLDPAGSIVAGIATGAVGISFLGIGMLVAQFMRTSRGANGVSSAILGLAFFLRGIGDAAGTPSADLQSMTSSWLSWLSPIGWAQHAGAFTQDSLLPLALNLLLAGACVVAVFALQSARDSGASLLAGRPGRSSARPALSGSRALLWRLQWPTIVGWSLGGAAFGLLAGSLATLIGDATATTPAIAEILQRLSPGQKSDIDQALVWAMFSFVGVMAAGCAVQVVIRMRQEETAGTAELLLAAPVSRMRWLGDYLSVGVVSVVLVLATSGTASALAAIATGAGGGTVADSFEAAAAQLPAALFYLGLLALVFVLVPALTAIIGWALLAGGLFVGLFGAIVSLPEWTRALSPFAHNPGPGSDPADWLGGAALVALAGVGTILAGILMRRRELQGA